MMQSANIRIISVTAPCAHFVPGRPLLHLAEENRDAGEAGREPGQVGIGEMIRDQDLGLKDLGGMDALVHGHRVRLVDREEGDVDILDIGHLRDVLRIAGDIDAESVDGEDKAIVTALRVEVRAALGVIVGGDGVQVDVAGELAAIAVGHHGAPAKHLRDAGVSDEVIAICAEGLQGHAVEVVAVLVGDQDDIGLRELRGVVGRDAEAAYWVDVDGQALVHDLQRAVLDEGDADGKAAVGEEGLDSVLRDGLAGGLPAFDAADEVADGIAGLGQFLGRFAAAAAGPAIDGDRGLLRADRLDLLQEIGRVPVDVGGTPQVAFGIFFGGADIDEEDGRIGGLRLKVGNFQVRDGGSAGAGHSAEKGGEKGHGFHGLLGNRGKQFAIGRRLFFQRQRIGAGGRGHPPEPDRTSVDVDVHAAPHRRDPAAEPLRDDFRRLLPGGDKRVTVGNPGEQPGDVRGRDHLQEGVGRIVLQAAHLAGGVVEREPGLCAERPHGRFVEALLLQKAEMVLVPEMDQAQDPPEIVQPVRIVERHAPPLRLGRKAPQEQHFRPFRQEGFERMALGWNQAGHT